MVKAVEYDFDDGHASDYVADLTDIDQTLSVDVHQRTSWLAMIGRVAQYRDAIIGLGELVDDLRGLFIEADPHNAETREDFESKWSLIDYEYELRSAKWAPKEAASDATLSARLDEFCSWVIAVVESDATNDHR